MSGLYNYVYSKVSEAYGGELNFSKLWLVKSEQVNIDVNELPYIPHIDKARYIKVMLYLDDVGINDGPIHLATVGGGEYESVRASLPKNYKSQKLNHIKDDLCYEPMIAGERSLVIFDTNCPHYAGEVVSGHVRRWRVDGIAQKRSHEPVQNCVLNAPRPAPLPPLDAQHQLLPVRLRCAHGYAQAPRYTQTPADAASASRK